jgi:hypothetical protein
MQIMRDQKNMLSKKNCFPAGLLKKLAAARQSVIRAGLPDCIFFKPKIPVWVNFGEFCN